MSSDPKSLSRELLTIESFQETLQHLKAAEIAHTISKIQKIDHNVLIRNIIRYSLISKTPKKYVDLLDEMCKMKAFRGLDKNIAEFFTIFPKFQKLFNYIKLNVSKDDDPASIRGIIKSDNVNKLKQVMKDPKFKLDQQISIKENEKRWISEENIKTIPLITFSMLYGAVNCFKHFHSLKTPVPSDAVTVRAALVGGNVEIVKLLEQSGIECNELIPVIASHNEDMFIHIIEKNRDLLNEAVMCECIRSEFIFGLKQFSQFYPQRMFEMACDYCLPEIIEFAYKFSGINPYPEAFKILPTKKVEILKVIIKFPLFNVNYTKNDNQTLFGEAMKYQYIPQAKALLQHPQINCNIGCEKTPLYVAVENKSEAIYLDTISNPSFDIIKNAEAIDLAFSTNESKVFVNYYSKQSYDEDFTINILLALKNPEAFKTFLFASNTVIQEYEKLIVSVIENKELPKLCYLLEFLTKAPKDYLRSFHLAIRTNLVSFALMQNVDLEFLEKLLQFPKIDKNYVINPDPLVIAIKTNKKPIVDKILEQPYVDINRISKSPEKYDTYPLLAACYYRVEQEIIDKMLENQKLKCNTVLPDGRSALGAATMFSDGDPRMKQLADVLRKKCGPIKVQTSTDPTVYQIMD